MKSRNFFRAIIIVMLVTACAVQKNNIILRPDPGQEKPFEQAPQQKWQIIESQNGPPEDGISEWVECYLNKGITGIESLDQYNGKYIFVGESTGIYLSALEQWAKNYSPAHDFPRLLALRVEKKIVASASLYPDDEYGEYFELLIKSVYDGEYQAKKGEVFWIKQRKIPASEDEENFEPAVTVSDTERYIFFVLLSIEKDLLQNQIRRMMAGIKTNRQPTREQSSAISRLQSDFFEGF